MTTINTTIKYSHSALTQHAVNIANKMEVVAHCIYEGGWICHGLMKVNHLSELDLSLARVVTLVYVSVFDERACLLTKDDAILRMRHLCSIHILIDLREFVE